MKSLLHQRRVELKEINDGLREAARLGNDGKLKAFLINPMCKAMSGAMSGGKDGKTALIWAAIYGHEACVELLLPVSDALSKDCHGWTALMWAASFNQVSCVKMLLPVSDIMHKSVDDKTASGHARFGGHNKLADFMDAYTLAATERTLLHSSTSPAAASRSRSFRV